MQFQRKVAVAVACVLIAGCALVGRPATRSSVIRTRIIRKSDTAIVVCAEQEPGFICGITGVDDKSTWSKTDGGKTPWVRVLPGTRIIRLTLSNSHLINRPWLKIDNVQAGHVYRVTAHSTERR